MLKYWGFGETDQDRTYMYTKPVDECSYNLMHIVSIVEFLHCGGMWTLPFPASTLKWLDIKDNLLQSKNRKFTLERWP